MDNTFILRPLTLDDIPRLSEIRPTYRSDTILALQKSGTGLTLGWQLVERRLATPFDKGSLYDFDEDGQAAVLSRFNRPDETYQRVIEHNGKLVALLDLELQAWNNTTFLWNLMIDVDYRGQGLGRRLWHRALDFSEQMEVRAIMIETQNTNPAACRFYERMDCQLIGLNEAYYTNNGTESEIALFWAYFFNE